MLEAFGSTVGVRIRYYRKKRKMTQKQLGDACGFSGPAIRNYELGNRTPNEKALHKIAAALHVNYYALADPDLSSFVGTMHCLFQMENEYGLIPVVIDGKTVLAPRPTADGEMPFIQLGLDAWRKMRENLETGKWTQEQYEECLSQYPVAF